VEDVIRVFARVNKRIPSKILMVGDGPERYKLEEMCSQLGLCSRVKFIGKVRDTQAVLEISDLFILPSETESFGLAALEAMAVGVPVISSNTGGIPEVNVHGETGFLSDVGDVDDMAKNALYILSDKKRLHEFKSRARKHSENFNLDKVVEQYEALYRQLL
jgi:N-acetyl-alpha-D-glucosaminyl L-malate synthase BshA